MIKKKQGTIVDIDKTHSQKKPDLHGRYIIQNQGASIARRQQSHHQVQNNLSPEAQRYIKELEQNMHISVLQTQKKLVDMFQEAYQQTDKEQKKLRLSFLRSFLKNSTAIGTNDVLDTIQKLPQKNYCRRISDQSRNMVEDLLRQGVEVKDIIKATKVSRSSIRTIRLCMQELGMI